MNRAGQHHAPKARHTLFALFRLEALRDDDNTELTTSSFSAPRDESELSSSRLSEKKFLDMLNRSQRTIFQICLHYTDRSPDAIRDLYQEIVCNLWESWPNFRGDSSTDTWVRRVSLNVAVTEIRRHAKQPRFVPLEDWMYDTISEEIDKAPPDYFRLISALDPDERALLYFRLEKLSIRDIAETLSTTEAAVKQRLYRLRQHIDTLKQKQYNEE